MRRAHVLLIVGLLAPFVLSGCERSPHPKPVPSPKVLDATTQTAQSSADTETPAVEPLRLRLTDPRAMAEEVLIFELQQNERGFVSPQPPTCKTSGGDDPWLFQCGITVVDPRNDTRTLVDIEIYDRDLDFETQAKMISTITAAMSTDGYLQIKPDVVERLKDGRTIPLQMVCNQGTEPVGPAFCMSLPNPRLLIVTISKPDGQQAAGGQAMDDANLVNRLVVAGTAHWARPR